MTILICMPSLDPTASYGRAELWGASKPKRYEDPIGFPTGQSSCTRRRSPISSTNV